MAMSPPQERVRVSVSYRHVMSPFREETMPVGVTAMDIEDASVKAGSAINNQKGGSGIQAKLDEFRDFVSRTCCSCVSRMPAILLVLAICLAIVLLLALIPAIFILTNAVQSEVPQALVSSKIEEINAIRTIPGLVADNETDEEVPMILGIPITSLYPPNISMSYGFGFTCFKEPSIVVSTAQRCDGFTDCPDGSDEQGCTSCQSWASCELENNYLSCLHGGHVCDNVKHCKNGFDEKEYCQSTCDNDQHKCKKENGIDICLPRMAVCDGHRDCADNSDEEQCSECAGGAKFCAVKNTCIPAQQVCNGVPDCDDYSDEKGCDLRSCSGIGKALCKTDGMCIEERNICDGHEDCSDGADEVNCPGYCKLESNKLDEIDGSGSQFCCKRDNTCHNASKRCDGKADCSDGEDEIDCTCEECMGRHANISLYMCGNSSRCLRREEACSPYSNCPNATFADKAFCAIQHLRNHERYDSVTMPI